METKTNVQRLLEQKKIQYIKHHCEEADGHTGAEIAKITGQNPDKVFKTLVTESGTKNHYVFVIPVEDELDLKKAAKSVGEKSITMLKSKDLLGLTGYIHGGCSPIGMKKFFRTTFDIKAKNFDSVSFSAGKIGEFVEVKVCDIDKMIRIEFADITVQVNC